MRIDRDERINAYFLLDDVFDLPQMPPYTIPNLDNKKRWEIDDPDTLKLEDWEDDMKIEKARQGRVFVFILLIKNN